MISDTINAPSNSKYGRVYRLVKLLIAISFSTLFTIDTNKDCKPNYRF